MTLKGFVMRLFGSAIREMPDTEHLDRRIKILSARLATEAFGLRRAKVQLRTELMQEILDGRERPQNENH